jgi:hypothetical protein
MLTKKKDLKLSQNLTISEPKTVLYKSLAIYSTTENFYETVNIGAF